MSYPAAVQALDESILSSLHGTPAFAVPVLVVITIVGGGWGALAIIPFLFMKKTRVAAAFLVGALAIASGVGQVLKHLVARVRPCDALGWCNAISIPSPGGHSFPSGHATGSFAFAMFIAVVAPRWAAPAIVYACLVAWSRCVLGVHYPSDIFVGAVLGSVVGAGTAIAYKRWLARKNPPAPPPPAPVELASS